MTHYTNDIDNSVDDVIYECINPSSPKSFFLFAGAGSGKTKTLVNVLSRFKKEYGKDFKLKNRKVGIINLSSTKIQINRQFLSRHSSPSAPLQVNLI
ncbi:hypothetical protein EZS27_032056 [termite gut metagenome]|uniref:UvrD-like helicase ATP-binding domain-containing protein n=1 Tax=termite gut metagenome TaxID=433724 RepID=A0A5J4Q7Y6_9ZZZZ